MKDPIRTKQALKVGIEATLTNATQLTVTVDSESGSSAPSFCLDELVTWINNLSNHDYLGKQQYCNNRLVWWCAGYTLYKTDARQWGKYLGMTVTSTGANFVINGFEYEHELRVRF
jgi:hypothetical protein